jgi:hypothetical protein
MQEERVEELNELEQFLRQEDAVMEPNILSVLRRYISDGGNPATVVEMLSDNYAGTSSFTISHSAGRCPVSSNLCTSKDVLRGLRL